MVMPQGPLRTIVAECPARFRSAVGGQIGDSVTQSMVTILAEEDLTDFFASRWMSKVADKYTLQQTPMPVHLTPAGLVTGHSYVILQSSTAQLHPFNATPTRLFKPIFLSEPWDMTTLGLSGH